MGLLSGGPFTLLPEVGRWVASQALLQVLRVSLSIAPCGADEPFSTPHSAFFDTRAGGEAEPRRSIEFRGTCLYAISLLVAISRQRRITAAGATFA